MTLSNSPRLQKVVGHERIVITGLIVSDEFCKEVAELITESMFEHTWMRVLVAGCKAYFAEYGVSIKQNIASMISTMEDGMSEAELDLITSFLELLSKDYEKIASSFNVQFYVDEATQFAKKKRVEETISRAQGLIVMGKIDDADSIIAAHNAKYTPDTRGFCYSDDESSYGFFDRSREEVDTNIVLNYPKAVGQLIGPCRRSWLGAFLAPMKRGKSNFLMESALLGVLNGRNVFVAIHEMQEKDWFDRLLANIVEGVLGEAGTYSSPMFDCLSNREGTCIKPCRVNREAYQRGQNIQYKPCLVCEYIRDGGFKPCVSEVPSTFDSMTVTTAKNKIKSLFGTFGRGRIIAKKYPAKTANSKTLYRDWRYLADNGDVCDIIVSDYADIQGLEDKTCHDNIRNIDDTWLGLKWLADTTKALVLTATQGKLKSLTAEDIEQDDVSGYIGKAAHVDFIVGLAQTKDEKAHGIMRLNNLYHRFASCNDGTYCTVLQRLDRGKYILDSRLGKFS